MIMSDQLVVRSYSSHEAWKPGPMAVDPPRTEGRRMETEPAPVQAAPVPQPTPAVVSPEVQAELLALVSVLSHCIALVRC